MLLDENSCFLSTVLRTHFKEEYRAVLLLDENSCFLSTVLRTNFKEEYKAVMLLDENSCFLSTVLRTNFKEEYKAVMLLDENSCFFSLMCCWELELSSLESSSISINMIPDISVTLLPPLFPPALWNVHDLTLTDGDRTNSFCEGWNNSFAKLVGHNHPTIWRLITHLKEDTSIMQTTVMMEARQTKWTKDCQ